MERVSPVPNMVSGSSIGLVSMVKSRFIAIAIPVRLCFLQLLGFLALNCREPNQ